MLGEYPVFNRVSCIKRCENLDFFHQKLSILHPNGGACDAAHTILRCKHLNNQAPILRDNGGESIRCQFSRGNLGKKAGKLFALRFPSVYLGTAPPTIAGLR